MDPFEERLRAMVAACVYKDWSFALGKDGIGLWYLQVRFNAPDAKVGEHADWSGRKWRISMHMSASEIVQTALKAVLAAEEHEARERFLYRGRAIFGPHFDVNSLWDLAGRAGSEDRRQ